jgi:hypothetical protein
MNWRDISLLLHSNLLRYVGVATRKVTDQYNNSLVSSHIQEPQCSYCAMAYNEGPCVGVAL